MRDGFNQNKSDDHLAETGWLELDNGMVGHSWLRLDMDLTEWEGKLDILDYLVSDTVNAFPCATNRVIARRLHTRIAQYAEELHEKL